MEIIHELESTPRDIYTGAIGFITPENDFSFNVPIRTISFPKDSNIGTLGIGGGIIHESDVFEEWEESKLKASFITGLNEQFKLIETFLYDAKLGESLRFERHLERLENSASAFGFAFDKQYVEQAVKQHLSSVDTSRDLKVRLLMSYLGELTVSSEAMPVVTSKVLPHVGISSYTIDADSLFRRHKTTNRAIYNQAFSKGEQQGLYDVLFFNQYGMLAEASRHNVYLEKDGTLYTPRIEDGALPGVMRDALISGEQHLVVEKSLTKDDLLGADRVYLSNSVRQLVEVSLIHDASGKAHS
jgi:para-aminobenzoate synthetase/4-amino-4-deoxychorismate lyase